MLDMRNNKRFFVKAVIWLLFIVYLLVLIKITVIRDGLLPERYFKGTLNLIPFAEYIRLYHAGAYFSILYYFLGNIVWFVPFGFFSGIIHAGAVRRPFVRTVIMAIAFSAFIEILQYSLGTGVTELDDLLLNTAGAALGYVVLVLLRKFVRYMSRLMAEHRNSE